MKRIIAKKRGNGSLIRLEGRLLGPGQWQDGKILLSRDEIRRIANETGVSVRQVLGETVYHEAWHGLVEPIGQLFSWCLGVDDIYDNSYEAKVSGLGKGYWYHAEEWSAETFGRLRWFIRDRYGWR